MRETTIREVADVSGGLTKNAKRDAHMMKRPFLTVANVYANRLELDEVAQIGVLESELPRVLIKKGDVLMVEGNGSLSQLGRAAIWTGAVEGCVHQNHLIKLRPRRGVGSGWLLYWLLSPDGRRAIEVESLPVRVCPPDEQDRIVEAIDTHFSRLDAAVALLERSKANLKRARAAVLKAAVEGRLVPTEAELARGGRSSTGTAGALARLQPPGSAQDLTEAPEQPLLAGEGARGPSGTPGGAYEPASVLLERILAERRAQWTGKGKYKEPAAPDTAGLPDLPEGWVWASMDQLLTDIEAGKSFAAENVPPSAEEIGIVKVSAVTWGTYDEQESKTVHEESLINPAYFVQPGDLLFSRANTIDLVGAAVIAERVTRKVMLSDKILRLHVAEEFKRWVLWVLRSQHGRRQIESLATGNQESMRNIGQDRIRQIAIPLPPLAEQHRIVAEVDRRLSVLTTLEATVDTNLARCARLRQAILKRAFEGRLVAPDAAAYEDAEAADGP